jgi:TPR repeat protein
MSIMSLFGLLISIVTFPGVVVHELAHVAFCKFTDTRVLKACYFRVGNPTGYVIHEQPSTVWRNILIGVGPFFVNTFLGFMLGIIAIPLHMDWDHPTPAQLLLLWLGVSIAMHSFPSTGDARNIWHAVWSKGAPISARVIGSPLVIVIFAGAIGSIFWLDALYGVGVVGAADALQKASQRDYAALPGLNPSSAVTLEKRPSKPAAPSSNQEFYAWEKTADGAYKQVKKDYPMDEQVCKNVIDVLNAMSLKQPQSNWIVANTTDSTFECRPAGVNPNGRSDTQAEISEYSDNPPPVSPAEEFRRTKAKAERGILVAELSLADFYREGKVVPRDYAQALKWARKAADQNDPLAQYLVAGFYSEGWGVQKDPRESLAWLLKAAYNGLDMAQKSVAQHYYLGLGAEQNSVEAYAWLNLAAKTDKTAAEHRDNMEKWLTKSELAAAQRRSEELSSLVTK